MKWVKDGVNYWENEDCPKQYLEEALVRLVNYVQDVELPKDYFKSESRENIIKEIEFYEDVADK